MDPTDNVLRLFPAPAKEIPAEDVYEDLRSPPASGLLRDGSRLAINMVSTLDGKVSVGGKASPIGSVVDRLVMRNIRCAFDAVLVGAGTVRAEEMNLSVPAGLAERRKALGLPEQPLGVVLAGSGELPLERKVFRPRGGQRIVVIAGDATPEPTLKGASALGALVLRAEGSELPAPGEIFRALNENLGVCSVLLEGGPTVNGAFLSAGKVDELFMTLSPKISLSGRDAPPIALADTAAEPLKTDLQLASVHACAPHGELYLRYLRASPQAGSPC